MRLFLNFLRTKIGWLLLLALLIAGILVVVKMVKTRDERIAELATKLATSERTIEIKDSLYAVKTNEIKDLNKVIETLSKDGAGLGMKIDELLKQLREADQKVLTLQGLVVYWKKAYEGAVDAAQSEPSEQPGRTRVDFKKDFGFIGVTGHTLTNPAEGYVKVEQLRPLKLAVVVTKNWDSTWSSLVSSSEDNVSVDIALSGVDLSVTNPRWYQRFWIDAGVNFLEGKSVNMGLSYRFNRWSLGASCTISNDSGCGTTVGFRIFK